MRELIFFLADREAAFQEIFHVHLYVIPKFKEDGFGLKFSPNYRFKSERKELDETAGKIKKAIESLSFYFLI